MMLRTTKVYEKSKHRMRLLDIGFSGLTLLMGEMTVTMPVAKNLVEMVTGKQLNALDLFGNCQRPVFSLGVSKHMCKK